MPTYEEDMAWQARFYGHASEIVREYVRQRYQAEIDRSSIEDDWKRNTDGFIKFNKPLPDNARLSQRVRRLGYRSSYQFEQTIRVDRPYSQQGELLKLVAGYGDIELYGFGPDDSLGTDGPPLRFEQWFLGDLNILRRYIAEGGYLRPLQRNKDGSSRFTVVDLRDLPEEYVLASDGLPSRTDGDDGWFACRNPQWHCTHPKHDKAVPLLCPDAGGHWKLRHGMCAGNYTIEIDGPAGDSGWRRCLSCGFRWKAGWSSAQTLRVDRARRVLSAVYPAGD